MEKLTWLEIVNLIFEAHRTKDLVREKILMDMLDEVEPDFADTLDRFDYA
jgi:hypothetical protein